MRFAASLVAIGMLGFSALRVVLFLAFGKGSSWTVGGVVKMFAVGALSDLAVVLLLVTGILLLFAFTPNRFFARPTFRGFWQAWLVLGWAGFFFLLVVEYHFFAEFNSRFNTVAVDYVLYPYEVFINIWDSYPVLPLLGGSICAGLAAAFVVRRIGWQVFEEPQSRALRFKYFLGTAVLAAGVCASLHFRPVRLSDDRVINEVGENGLVSLFAAAITRELDYSAFYQTVPPAEAQERARRLVAGPRDQFRGRSTPLQRHIPGDPSRPRHNVVLILEESLGSEFWGSLGRKGPTLTPQMDQLALQEGLFFTNFYASGNRTVRGLEGVLCSFPPLPGDSIVVRRRSRHVETVARVLKRDGYTTQFLYGGRGVFDGMRTFMLQNGYDRFIERKDFPNPTHTTVWGVCDEDLFHRSLQEMRSLVRQDKPFFMTLLTVSNHKPFTYPEGRIPESPRAKSRDHAVKYADFALGQFFRAVRSESFYSNTLFVVVADHGARVYGSQSIPLHSYEIPLVMLGPGVIGAPRQLSQPGSSLDVAPTLLGLIGRPYDSVFFGRDILQSDPDKSWLVMHHNRDIGMLQNDRLLVLGINKSAELYLGNPKAGPMRRQNGLGDASHEELRKDTISVFQMADELYTEGRYRILQ